MKRVRTIEELKKALLPLWETHRFNLIAVFGSFATGKLRSDSDLDIGFIPKVPMDEVMLSAEMIRNTHWNDVDVVNLYKANSLLAMQIAKTGISLFSENPSTFTEFKSLAFRKFIDTEKLRTAQKRALDKFEKKDEPN